MCSRKRPLYRDSFVFEESVESRGEEILSSIMNVVKCGTGQENVQKDIPWATIPLYIQGSKNRTRMAECKKYEYKLFR